MTKEEVQQKFILRLLKVVNKCDLKIMAAYEERQKALTELNEWFVEAWKEAEDGEILSDAGGRLEAQDPQLEACCDAIWRHAFRRPKSRARR